MPVRKPGETISQFAIRVAWEYGHFWDQVANPEGPNVKQSDLANLNATDDVVVRAMISLAKMDSTQYTINSLNAGESPDFSGTLNEAMKVLVQDKERCPVPDHAPPPGVVFAFDDPDLQALVLRMQQRATLAAIGTGNWAGCHNIGNFHSAAVRVDASGLPSFLAPVFTTVLRNVQKAYADVGLLWRFINQQSMDMLANVPFSGTINSDMSFVGSSGGWIGLAIVGQNETCASKIWCKFLATYKGGSDNAAIITQWTSLIKHELGHNCGRGHTNGGVMNPSIVNGLPTEWGPNDPSTGWLKAQFGGVPVPIPGSTPPGPGPGPDPPITVESRLHALEIQDVVQKATIGWAVGQIRKLTGT